MLLLALDTATPALTVAVHDGSRVLAGQTTVSTRKHGELLAAMISQVLADAGAARGDLTAVAVGTGPGPYTGLRAGLVTAQVLASALGIPAVGVCTLDVIARAAVPAAAGREFLVASDARRKEVYWARYTPAGECIAGPDVGPPESVFSGGDDPPEPPRHRAVGDGRSAGPRHRAVGDGRSAGPRHRAVFEDGPPAPPQHRAVPGDGLPVAGEGPVLYPELAKEPIPPRYPDAAQLGVIAAELLAAGGPPPPPHPLYLRRPDAQVPGKPKRVTP